VQCVICVAIPYLVVPCQGECNYSSDEEQVCCHFMFQWVIGQEIDGGVI